MAGAQAAVPERGQNQSDFVFARGRFRSAIEAISALTDAEYELLRSSLVAKQEAPSAFPLPVSPELFAKVCREHRRPLLTPEERRRAAEMPDFDDPDFEAKLGAATATVGQNKRALVRIWNALSDDDRRAFLVRIASPADLRRALA